MRKEEEGGGYWKIGNGKVSSQWHQMESSFSIK
jgi:hypothetical protein